MAVASLVLGIISLPVSLFLNWILGGWASIALGVVGIVLGALNKNPEKKGVATAGKVCAIIGLVIGLIKLIACSACAAGLGSLL